MNALTLANLAGRRQAGWPNNGRGIEEPATCPNRTRGALWALRLALRPWQHLQGRGLRAGDQSLAGFSVPRTTTDSK